MKRSSGWADRRLSNAAWLNDWVRRSHGGEGRPVGEGHGEGAPERSAGVPPASGPSKSVHDLDPGKGKGVSSVTWDEYWARK